MALALPQSGAPGTTWTRALSFSLVTFGLAAPWSIAIAQTAIVLTALIALTRAIRGDRDGRILPLTLWMVGAYLLVQALAIPLGIHPAHSLVCYKGSWILLFPLVFWFALRDDVVRRRAYTALVVGAALAAVYGIVQHFQGIDWLHDRRPLEARDGRFIAVGNFGGHLTYAGVQLPLVFFALGRALDSRGRHRAILLAAAALIASSVVFSFARTTWLGVVAGFAFFSLSLSWRSRALTAIVAGGGAAALITQSSGLWNRLLSLAQVTDMPRWRLWETALHIVRDHPAWGAGLGSFPTLFPIYKVAGEYKSTIHPHSDVLNAAVETGIVGAAVWIGIWIAFFAHTRHRPAAVNRRWTVIGIRAGVFALLVAGLGQCFSTDEEVAGTWFFLLAAALVETHDPRARGVARALEKWFKARTLPLARRAFASRRPVTRPEDASRLLVVRHDDRLGNLLLMTPFLQRLRIARPDAHIGMVVGSAYADLLRGWPWVDEWIVQDKRKQATTPWIVPGFVRELRRTPWEVAFEMSNHNTHSYSSCLMALLSGAPNRIGFEEPRNEDTLTHASPTLPPTTHFSLAPLRLLEHLDVDAGAADMACPLADVRSPPPPAPYTVVHLDARGGKALDLDTWERFLLEAVDTTERRLIVLEAPEAFRASSPVFRHERVVAHPRSSIGDVARLIRSADAYVGCDTGVMHLAVAVGTPTLSIFFRSNPYHYAPLGDRHAIVLLANPYRVVAEEWERPVMGRSRGRLFASESSPERSAAGLPQDGPEALDVLLAGLAHVLAATRSHV